MRDPLYPKIDDGIPHFIKREYPRAHKLLMDFYKWLESDENYVRVLTEFREGQEVNNEVAPYVDLFVAELGWRFNKKLTISKSALIASLRDFYLSRGSENGFRYLFRVLFGEEDARVSYPRERLFTLSNADYSKDCWILTTANNMDSEALRKILDGSCLIATIEGQTSGLLVNVERAVPIIHDGTQYIKFLIGETPRDFIPLESLIITADSHSVFETIFACTKLKIEEAGAYYEVGDEIVVEGATIRGFARVGGTRTGSISDVRIINAGDGYAVGDAITAVQTKRGSGFFAIVSKVDDAGGIQAIKFFGNGYDYDEVPRLVIRSKNGRGGELRAESREIGGIKSVEIIDQYWRFDESVPRAVTVSSATGERARVTLDVSGCISKDTATYKNRRGVLEENCIIHDSDFFQHFSYEVNSKVASAKFNDAVDDMLHPVGFKRYNVFFNETSVSIPTIRLFINVTQQNTLQFNDVVHMQQPYGHALYVSKHYADEADAMLFSINNLQKHKFSQNLTYTAKDFGEMKSGDFDVIRMREPRTLDPEVIQS